MHPEKQGKTERNSPEAVASYSSGLVARGA